MSTIAQWRPKVHDEVWFSKDGAAPKIRATIVQFSGDDFRIRLTNSTAELGASLDELTPIDSDLPLLDQLTTAPDAQPDEQTDDDPEPSDDDPKPPDFIRDKADLSISQQVAYVEAVADAVRDEADKLASTLKPFLSGGEVAGEADDAKHDQPALPDEASPLAERLNQAQGKLAAAYRKLRYIARRLQP